MTNNNGTLQQTAYDFYFNSLGSDTRISLADFKGHVILVVNTASKCGFTPQYEGLEQLYQKYKDKGLVIIGVPSNDFASQELEKSSEIANFCKVNYGVTFLMSTKERVIGANAHPFYIWAKKILGFGSAPKWNFHKYIINRQGYVVDYFYSITSPKSKRFISAIERQLFS